MFVVMKINPDHIREAEGILIGGAEFDPERIEFINFMDTVDLLAVPGSGKTTALLAKLYCMAKQMPFPDNAGILVLAHTNHAIQEIEKVLKPICPQLFSYPNFVGTVQSFANKFIANQANFDLYGSYIRKNDDEISENEFKVNSIAEELDRKILINTLKTDFRLLLRKDYLIEKQFENTLDIVYQSKYGNKYNYLFVSKADEKQYKIVRSSRTKEKISISFDSENNIFAERIVLQHKNIKLKIELNYLQSEPN